MVGDYCCRCALLLLQFCQQIAVGLCHHQHVVHGEHLAFGVAPFIVCNGHHITHLMAVFGAAVRAVEALAATVPCASFNGISVGRIAEVEAEGRHILARQTVVAACRLGRQPSCGVVGVAVFQFSAEAFAALVHYIHCADLSVLNVGVICILRVCASGGVKIHRHDCCCCDNSTHNC